MPLMEVDTSQALKRDNAAILPEYGGSNLGVPVAKVRELLERANMN